MITALTDSLSVTHAQQVRDLDPDHEYDFIVTMGYFDQLGYTRPEYSDTGDEHVFPDGPHEYTDFKDAVDSIREALATGKNVLVHCQAGCSRSPSACIAVLAVEDGYSYEEAYERVRRLHEKTNPTPELEASARRYIQEQL